MNEDQMIESLDEILDSLAFEENLIKTVRLTDRREVVLVRINPFTLARFYVTGRPDGKRPHGRESYFEDFNEQLRNYKESHGSDEGFSLTPEDWRVLFNESTDRYVRYLFFSGLKRWEVVKRDTETNIAVADMAKKYAPDEVTWDIYQYKGYMLMMNTISKTELSLMRADSEGALANLDMGIALIGKFCGECLREGKEEAENITRERYLSNLIQLRSDIEAVNARIQDRLRRRRSEIED